MVRAQARAMGTEVSVLLPQTHAWAAGIVWDLFEQWEATLSRFRPDSELAYLNARGGAAVRVSRLLLEVTAAALHAAAWTGGAFDPTVLRALEASGYDRTFEAVAPDGPALRRVRTRIDWRAVRLDVGRNTVQLPYGVGLDFGGIAKGMAVDRALDTLARVGVPYALLDAGGDLAVRGLPPGQPSWTIAVPGPQAVYAVHVERGALATTGRGRRHWLRGGERQHHVIDPRTGRPVATGLWAVTVVAGRCGRAEAAAKAAFVRGVTAGGDWLAAQGLGGLFQDEEGAAVPIGAWPQTLQRLA